MTSNTKNHEKTAFQTSLVLLALSAGTLAFAWVLSLVAPPAAEPATHGAAPMSMGSPVRVEHVASPYRRLALRLEKRLASRGMPVPPVQTLEHALELRRSLLDREVVLSVDDGSTSDVPHSTVLRMVEHPEWIAFTSSPWSAEYAVSADAIAAALQRGDAGDLPLLRTAEVLSMARDKHDVMRAEVSTVARSGYAVDVADTAAKIAAAFGGEDNVVAVTAPYHEAVVKVRGEDGTERTLTLLSTGMSDYSDSSADREHNVFKAFNERLQNVVIEPGEIFSLVDALDAPITLSKGWKEEKGLFGGGAALTPGAGICQSATTLYRAALLAGLPLVSKKAHSLFVDHYEFYGIGLDATVFPGVQDLVFKNDTQDIIVVQTLLQDDQKKAFISFYGHDDGRSVALDGPYFVNSKKRPKALPPVSVYQIGWTRTISYADGREKTEPLISTYAKPLWNSLMRKYDVPEGMTLLTQRESTAHMQKIAAAEAEKLHAAAPENPAVNAELTNTP